MLDDNNQEGKKFGRDLKVIIVGDLSTGKTSILNRYINEKFEETNQATIAPEFAYKFINSNDVIFRIQFWDIPGQSRNPEITGLFCRDTQGIIFCAESGNKKSIENIKIWEESLTRFEDIKNLPKIIVENKCDLLGDESHYNDNIDSLKKISKEHNFSGYFRTSALTGYNINEAINFLIEEMIKSVQEEEIQFYNSKNTKLDITTVSNYNKNRCC